MIIYRKHWGQLVPLFVCNFSSSYRTVDINTIIILPGPSDNNSQQLTIYNRPLRVRHHFVVRYKPRL